MCSGVRRIFVWGSDWGLGLRPNLVQGQSPGGCQRAKLPWRLAIFVIVIENMCNISYNEGIERGERGQQSRLMSLRERRKLPSGVRDEAPPENDVTAISKTKTRKCSN